MPLNEALNTTSTWMTEDLLKHTADKMLCRSYEPHGPIANMYCDMLG